MPVLSSQRIPALPHTGKTVASRLAVAVTNGGLQSAGAHAIAERIWEGGVPRRGGALDWLGLVAVSSSDGKEVGSAEIDGVGEGEGQVALKTRNHRNVLVAVEGEEVAETRRDGAPMLLLAGMSAMASQKREGINHMAPGLSASDLEVDLLDSARAAKKPSRDCKERPPGGRRGDGVRGEAQPVKTQREGEDLLCFVDSIRERQARLVSSNTEHLLVEVLSGSADDRGRARYVRRGRLLSRSKRSATCAGMSG